MSNGHLAMLYVGQNVRKATSGRRAQITALDDTHATVYWPDDNTQTQVKTHRLETRRSEWDLEPDHHSQRWPVQAGPQLPAPRSYWRN